MPQSALPANCATDRIVRLLGMLDRLASGCDPHGVPTTESHQILQNDFTGDFLDSSASQRLVFPNDLRVLHPDKTRAILFHPWLDRVRHQTLRVGCSLPGLADEPLDIGDVGHR